MLASGDGVTGADNAGRALEPVRLRPDFAFMRPRLSRWIAFGAGSGLTRFGPGTVGTLAAWIVFALLDPWLGDRGWLVVAVVAFGAGIWASDRTARDLGVADHGSIVIDEIVAFWLVLLMLPGDFGTQFWAFVLFRIFDIVKPPPIRQLDRNVHGGFGVMLDDLVAAFFTLLVFALLEAVR